MKSHTRKLLATLTMLALLSTINHQLSTVFAQGTAFTYQGELQSGGALANGAFNLQFFLYTNSSGGTAVAGPVTTNGVVVSNGLFTVTIDFGGSVWNGATNWLEIAVETNGGGSFTTLAPRQQATPAPYSISAENLNGTVRSGGLSGTYGNAVTLSNSANQFTGTFTGNAGGLTNVSAQTLGGLAASKFWQISGNSGTTAGTNFLGTTDNQPLELHVNSQRGLRLEPTTDGANFIGGGSLNSIQQADADCTISGGQNSVIQSNTPKATISGGYGHTIEVGAYESTIGGGFGNTIGSNSPDATIAGGFEHFIQYNAANAVIGGGYQNSILGYVPNQGVPYPAVIAGGRNNTISNNSANSSIGGGAFNSIQSESTYSTIGGGYSNVIAGQVGATIAGGGYDGVNPVYGNVVSANGSAVGGGVGNNIQPSAGDSTIGGGYANTIQTSSPYATIAGGYGNTIHGSSPYSVIAGGYSNNVSGQLSFAAGGQAIVSHNNDFVWSDNSAPTQATLDNEFVARASAGYVFLTSIDNTTGAVLPAGAGCWNSCSDRNAKNDFAPVNPQAVLAEVTAIPVTTWSYKTEHGVRHIGPMAQDFYAAFQVGEDDRHIAEVDEGGVALAAIQGLNEKVEGRNHEEKGQIEELKTENAELKARLEKLEQLINSKKGDSR